MMRKFLTSLLPLLLVPLSLALLSMVPPSIAQAQVQLPSVRLPSLQGGGGLLGTGLLNGDRTLSNLTGDLDPKRLEDLRRLRILDLIRSHPKEIEADPNGAPILRGEVVVFAPSEELLGKARAAGFAVLRERTLEGLDARLVILKVPDHTTTRRALERLKALDSQGVYDFNHVYLDSGEVGGTAVGGRVTQGTSEVAERSTAGAVAKVGLVDGGVDVTHPVFHDIVIHQHGCSGKQVPGAHGTAVASLMIGRSASFHGAAPGSELYAADVYCGLPTGGAVDAVADALAWLVREHVAVINVSLVGPPNAMLENVVRMVVAHGHIVVAAVGNDGAAAPPLYPASYPDVVGVTGVDSHQRALLEACRGRQVKFAAPGADIFAANPSQSYVKVRGTSFAAPIVAGLLAEALHEPDPAAAQRAVSDLAAHAKDLGPPGPDSVYGFGLVGGDPWPELAQRNTPPRP